MTTKHRAKCACKQCGLDYECSIYDAAKSKVGHLCLACKTQVTSLTTFDHKDLQRVLNYDRITGRLTYANDSISGPKGKAVGYLVDTGYLNVAIGRKEYLLHRVIWFMMTGHWPETVDHINHDRTDNRWENLRNIPGRENQKNMGVSRKNTSGVTGVRVLPSGKFNATIVVNRVQLGLGSYLTLEEAIAARRAAEQRYGFHANHGT